MLLRHSLEALALDHSRFTWSGTKKWFVAEASNFTDQSLHHRLYDDAVDVGIAIRGRAGVVIFYLAEEVRDTENELLVTIYRPVAECVRKNGALQDVEVHILND